MKNVFFYFVVLLVLFPFSATSAENNKATPKDVYDLVLKAYEVVSALGEESFPAFNDPKGEFVYKDTYVFIQKCPHKMLAHPFALDKLKDVDLNKFPFNERICEAANQPNGGWAEYNWPKPNETEPSRKLSFAIKVEGKPFMVAAGIYNDAEKVEDLNKNLR